MIGKTDSRPHVTTAITLQIYNQIFHPFCLQLLHGLFKLLDSRGSETGNLDIPDILVNHVRGIDTVNRNHVPHDIEINPFIPSLHLNFHHGSFLPFQTLPHVRVTDTDSRYILPINLRNPITGEQPDLFRRSSRDHVNYG